MNKKKHNSLKKLVNNHKESFDFNLKDPKVK